MVEGTNEVAENIEEFDYESIVLRRSDPDDFDEILNLGEIGTEDIYNRVYSFPNVLKLIETAYLAITVLDREGRIVAFAAFEDHPTVSRTHSISLWPSDVAECSRALAAKKDSPTKSYQARRNVLAVPAPSQSNPLKI